MNGFDRNNPHLRAIVEAAVGTPIAAVSPQIRFVSAEGGQEDGGKWFATFPFETVEGDASEVTLFVKRCVWKGRSEAPDYRWLAAHGVPVPQLYGVVTEESGSDILFLERLTATGIRNESETEWRAFFTLLARFNACPVSPEYMPHLHPYELVGRIGTHFWITGVEAFPTEAELTGYLRDYGNASADDLLLLVQAAQALYARVAAQPRALLHQDFLFNNVGWRGDRAEIVVFDVHKNALGPRFADVAPYLCVPDSFHPPAFTDDLTRDVSRRRALTEHYLKEHARFGGPVVSPVTFEQEATDLFWAHKVAILPYLAEQEQGAERVREVLDALRSQRR